MSIELFTFYVQSSDFDSSSEDGNEESDSDSSGCEWETEEEELLAVDSTIRLVEDKHAFRTYEDCFEDRTSLSLLSMSG